MPQHWIHQFEFVAAARDESHDPDAIPIWIGGGGDMVACCHCQFTVAIGIDRSTLPREEFYCPCCGTFLRVPLDWSTEKTAHSAASLRSH